MGYYAGEARCVDIDAQEHWENDYSCYKVTYKFDFDVYIDEYHPGKWKTMLLDAGGRYVNDSGELVVVDDDAGTKHGGLVLLNNQGGLLTPRTAEPKFCLYNTKYRAAFSAFNLS